MGRPLRTRIDFAKTLSWYDFFYNQLVFFKKYKNDYDMEKFFYGNQKDHEVKNLFKKYKFGLSTPQEAWIYRVESKCIGSSNIINHSLWKNLKYQTNDEELILIELDNQPLHIKERILINGYMQDFNESDLDTISKYGSLDSICTLYLLHQWGVYINSISLVNDCCKAILNSLELLLQRHPYLLRSHILLFDEIFTQIYMIEYKGYSRPLKIKFNWRQYRKIDWSEEIREKSIQAEADLLAHPKLNHLIPKPNQSLIDLYDAIL